MIGDEFRNAKNIAWLEEVVRSIIQEDSKQIAFCASLKNGDTLLAFHGCKPEDKARFAWHILSDAMLDVAKKNAGAILKAAVDEDSA